MKRFLDLAEFSREEVVDLLALAQRLQDRPEPAALAGKILGLLFLNPSLRTLASFQAGMARLGGQAFVVTPGQGTWQVETRIGAVMNAGAAEHVREAIPVLASYCDALGIRSFAEGKDLENDLAETQFRMMAQLCDKPLVNMESAVNHPCQALADWKTMDELGVPRSGKFVLHWVYHPKALPLAVPAATVHMAAQRGMEVVVCRPEGYALPDALMQKAHAAAKTAGGVVTETTDRSAALAVVQRSTARTCCTRKSGVRRCITAMPRPRPGCASRSSTGAFAKAGLNAHARTAMSCIACRCAAMSR
jgi:N-acetylornithine carbamoyltransferase